MADIIYPVNVALAEVPVNKFQLIDDGDGKTREESVAYDAAGMDLVLNFVTKAGAMSQTAVTPTTGGTYDWASQGNAFYSIEFPASGGASINNDTEGYGWFAGVATGVMPWISPIFEFGGTLQKAFGIASGTPTPTNIPTSLLVPAAATDKYNGQWLIFRHDTTTAALQGKLVLIQDTASDGTLTVSDCNATPVSGDIFDIYP